MTGCGARRVRRGDVISDPISGTFGLAAEGFWRQNCEIINRSLSQTIAFVLSFNHALSTQSTGCIPEVGGLIEHKSDSGRTKVWSKSYL